MTRWTLLGKNSQSGTNNCSWARNRPIWQNELATADRPLGSPDKPTRTAFGYRRWQLVRNVAWAAVGQTNPSGNWQNRQGMTSSSRHHVVHCYSNPAWRQGRRDGGNHGNYLGARALNRWWGGGRKSVPKLFPGAWHISWGPCLNVFLPVKGPMKVKILLFMQQWKSLWGCEALFSFLSF